LHDGAAAHWHVGISDEQAVKQNQWSHGPGSRMAPHLLRHLHNMASDNTHLCQLLLIRLHREHDATAERGPPAGNSARARKSHALQIGL
jgi:hypothetical protein